MKLTPEDCLFIFFVLYIGLWVFAFIKENQRIKKLPDEWECMSLSKNTSHQPHCPVCGENNNVIKNPFQDNNSNDFLSHQFWCISCDRKFNI
jgi:transposase-like protein